MVEVDFFGKKVEIKVYIKFILLLIISVYFHIKLFQSGPIFKKVPYKYSPIKNNLANSHRNHNLRKVGMNKYDTHE